MLIFFQIPTTYCVLSIVARIISVCLNSPCFTVCIILRKCDISYKINVITKKPNYCTNRYRICFENGSIFNKTYICNVHNKRRKCEGEQCQLFFHNFLEHIFHNFIEDKCSMMSMKFSRIARL